jgi:hypothetical protein
MLRQVCSMRNLDSIVVLVYLGVVFPIFAFWWHINNCTRYVRSLRSENDEKAQRQQIKFEGSTTYPCFWLPFKVCRHWPIESIVKIIVSSIDIIAKIHDGYESLPKPHVRAIWAMHIPMLLGFFLAGWVEILVHYKIIFPRRITQIMAALAFAMETLTMVFHTDERSILEAHIHRLLGMTMVCSTIVAIGECFMPNNFSFILARSYFMLTQGTWLFQSAFVLWPLAANPYFTWDPNSNDSVLYATMCFGFHMPANVIILYILFLIVHKRVSRSTKLYPYQVEDDDRMDGYKLIINENDEDN